MLKRLPALFAFTSLGLVMSAPAYAAPNCVAVRQTPRMLLSDARELARHEWSTLAIGLGAAALVHPLDDNADKWVDERPKSDLTAFGQYAGSWTAQAPLLTGMLTASAFQGCLGPGSADMVRAELWVLGLTSALKFSIQRERPNHESLHVSFPSGHSASTFALATVAQRHLGWKVGVPAYGIATYTAWSRVRDNKHWISDTVFGSALGIAIGRATTSTGRQSKWLVMPSASRGGASLQFVRQAH